jgi:hypothetical protein
MGMMKPIIFLGVLLAFRPMWTQSVADAARAARENKRASSHKVITNEDIDSKPTPVGTARNDDWERTRNMLRLICADPASNNGRNLRDADKQALEDTVKPLRARRTEFEGKLNSWKVALKELDEEEEKAIFDVNSKRTSFTEQDRNRVLAIRGEFESRRSFVKKRAGADIDEYERFKAALTATAAECQAAADSVK